MSLRSTSRSRMTRVSSTGRCWPTTGSCARNGAGTGCGGWRDPSPGARPSCRCWSASWPCAWWQARCCRWPRSARRRCPQSRRPGRRRRPRPSGPRRSGRAPRPGSRQPAPPGPAPPGPAPPGPAPPGPALPGPAGPATRRARQPRRPGRTPPADRLARAHPGLASAHQGSRVNPRRHDRYDFLPSEGVNSRRPLR